MKESYSEYINNTSTTILTEKSPRKTLQKNNRYCCFQKKKNYPNVKLFKHQEAMLYKTIEIEKEKDSLVLKDKAGVGKSYVILSHILIEKGKNSTILVVPQNIFTQWVKYIELFELKYKTVSNYNETVDLVQKDIDDNDIILISNMSYPILNRDLSCYRIVFDEIDTSGFLIKHQINAVKKWFVSASFTPNKTGAYKITYWEDFTCDDKFVKSSFRLPEPEFLNYKCYDIITKFYDIFTEKEISRLNAIDYSGFGLKDENKYKNKSNILISSVFEKLNSDIYDKTEQNNNYMKELQDLENKRQINRFNNIQERLYTNLKEKNEFERRNIILDTIKNIEKINKQKPVSFFEDILKQRVFPMNLLFQVIDTYTHLNCDFSYIYTLKSMYDKNLDEGKDIDFISSFLFTKEKIQNCIDENNKIIESNNTKKKYILERINEDTCLICMEEMDKKSKMISYCCKNVFCKKCLNRNPNKKCIICRIDTNFICIDKKLSIYDTTEKSSSELFFSKKDSSKEDSSKEDNNSEEDTSKGKLDVFRDLVKKNTDKSKRFLIFSDFCKSFNDIKGILDDLKIRNIEINGDIKTIDNNISKYRDGEIQAILVDSKLFGSGMNLENTTDIILLHDIEEKIKNQLIGRAQRLGRKNRLKVHTLVY